MRKIMFSPSVLPCQHTTTGNVGSQFGAALTGCGGKLIVNAHVFSVIIVRPLSPSSHPTTSSLPDEVASTKEIMSQLGLWPSYLGYEGLIAAYADLGDKKRLLQLFNEAWDVMSMRAGGVQQAPFNSTFVIQQYVNFLVAQPSKDGTCVEVSLQYGKMISGSIGVIHRVCVWVSNQYPFATH